MQLEPPCVQRSVLGQTCQHLERHAVIAGRLLERQRGRGVLPGSDGVVHGLGGVAERRGLDEMMRELCDRHMTRRALAFEFLGNPVVQAHTPCRRQTAVQCLTDKRVREREKPGVAGTLAEHAGSDGLLDAGKSGVLRDLRQRLHGGDMEVTAGDSAERQQPLARVAQCGEPPDDQIPQALRQP